MKAYPSTNIAQMAKETGKEEALTTEWRKERVKAPMRNERKFEEKPKLGVGFCF